MIEIHICYIFIYSFIVLFVFEALIEDDVFASFKFFKSNVLCYIYNFILVFLLIGSLSFITNDITNAYIGVSIVFIIVGVINHQMRFYRNEYIKPIDLTLFNESKDISRKLEFVQPKLLINLIVFTIAIFLISKIWGFNDNYKNIDILILLAIFFVTLQIDGICDKILRIKRNKFSDFQDYKSNGFLLAFIMDFRMFGKNTPSGYRAGISDVLLREEVTHDVYKKPNIIIIMNESFFDINKVSSLDLSYNPISNFEEISKNYTSGSTISPMIGGGTCQPEFEMLTGNSVIFTNKFKVAFIDFFKRKYNYFDSIAWTLRKLLYSCTFIHPYDKHFYNRENAYSTLGFEKILDISQFTHAFYPRSFISDRDCYKKLIDEFEKKQPNKPFFSVVVTMQNHPGYLDGEKYDEHGLEVLNDNLSKKEKIMLENYANLLKESDDAIKYITDYFKDKDNTIIMFFGDHQPSENIGFSALEKRDIIELSRTPFFIWDNFNLPKRVYGDISPFFLSSILLNIADIKSDRYFNYLYNKLSVLSALNTSFIIDAKGEYINRENTPLEIEKLIEELRLIQYDRIYKNIKYREYEYLTKK